MPEQVPCGAPVRSGLDPDLIDMGSNVNYVVRLDQFEGPLDLLLHLIQKEEMDIYDIPIARITEQYLRQIELMDRLDLQPAGDFLVMAATLLRAKNWCSASWSTRNSRKLPRTSKRAKRSVATCTLARWIPYCSKRSRSWAPKRPSKSPCRN